MEHRIILGGEQFLPFARSCVTKLKKLGLPYADQSYEVDGVSIKVRIEPGHEYIRIEGGSTDLKMDSGIVDVGWVGIQYPARYLPGVLTKPTAVLAYDSSFNTLSSRMDGIYTPAVGEGSAPTLTYTTPWFTKQLPTDQSGRKVRTSIGQVSGEIEKTSGLVNGYVRKDGVAKSFEPKRVLNGATPPVMAPEPADDLLVAKKSSSEICPPSIFTGKARLYAQALFGQYLYDGKNISNNPPIAVKLSGSPPYLMLSLYEDKNTERVAEFAEVVRREREAAAADGTILIYDDPYEITLNYNSGVYLDPMSLKHWLINPTVGKVTIYPLVSSPAGESMRKTLRKLSSDDRDHLEAYILSSCRPHAELRVVLKIEDVNPYAMGYGWHWNWSGTKADMVQTLYDFQRGDGSAISTHHRLTVTAAYDDASKSTSWVASTSVVESGKSWATMKAACSFTCPHWRDWSAGSPSGPSYMSMVVPWRFNAYGTFYNCDAPIYAFYKKDELQVFRFSTTVTTSNEREVEFSPGYAQWLFPNDPNNKSYARSYYTYGTSGGYLKDLVNIYTSYTHTISGGGVSCSVEHGKVKNGTSSRITNKQQTAWPEPTPFNPNGMRFAGANGSLAFQTGPPTGADPIFAATHDVTIVQGICYGSFAQYAGCDFTQSEETLREYPTGIAGAMIPFYDSEAVYVFQDTQYERHYTGRVTTQGHSTHWGREHCYGPTGSLIGIFEYSFWNPPASGSGSSVSAPDETEITNHVIKTDVSYKGGNKSINIVPGSAYGMCSLEIDWVGDTFKTVSNSSVGTPLLWGLINNDWPDGLNGRTVIVGWA